MGLRLSASDPFDDLDAIIPSMQATFYAPPTSAYTEVLWGPRSPAAVIRAKNSFLSELSADPTIRWMKVVDEETGRVASAAEWKVYPNFVAKRPEASSVDYWDGEERVQAEEILDALHRNVDESIAKFGKGGEAHIRLYILFTHPDYQRRGVGRLMVDWGCKLADHLSLPMWVEASATGRLLYQRCGFVDIAPSHVKTKRWELNLSIMRRPPKYQEFSPDLKAEENR